MFPAYTPEFLPLCALHYPTHYPTLYYPPHVLCSTCVLTFRDSTLGVRHCANWKQCSTSTDVGSQNITRAQTALASETEVDIGNWEAEFLAQKLEGRGEEGVRERRERGRESEEKLCEWILGSDGHTRRQLTTPVPYAQGRPVQNCFHFHIFTCSCLHPFRHIYVHIFSEEKKHFKNVKLKSIKSFSWFHYILTVSPHFSLFISLRIRSSLLLYDWCIWV